MVDKWRGLHLGVCSDYLPTPVILLRVTNILPIPVVLLSVKKMFPIPVVLVSRENLPMPVVLFWSVKIHLPLLKVFGYTF